MSKNCFSFEYSHIEIVLEWLNCIPARGFGKEIIKSKHGSHYGWPGPEDVRYWVELNNGWAVGIIAPTTKKGNAEFPMYLIK